MNARLQTFHRNIPYTEPVPKTRSCRSVATSENENDILPGSRIVRRHRLVENSHDGP